MACPMMLRSYPKIILICRTHRHFSLLKMVKPEVNWAYPLQRNVLQQPTFQMNVLPRFYAKGKDRKKENKNKTVAVNEAVLSQAIQVEELIKQMDHVVVKMKEEFVRHYTLRSSIGALDTIPVEFEGTEYMLQDLAQIGKKNQNVYVVNLSSFPQVIPNVLKALKVSGLGINPQQDGTTLFIPIPKVTKEHRETLAKSAKAVFIKTRDELRVIQNKFIKVVKNKQGLSEDLIFSIKEQITQMADKHIGEAEAILKTKQDELLKS